jgi:alpha-glucosidase
LASNRANARLRYELMPYYYTLAHRAHLFGDPIIAPALYADENDPALRGMGTEKLIGDNLLTALETHPDSKAMRVYLPKGEWFDYHTHEWHSSKGEWLENVPLYHGKLYRLPLYARAGAIIPVQDADTGSIDAFGRKQGSMAKPTRLKLNIFPYRQASELTLYEDDGETTAYLQGAVRTTRIRQQRGETDQQVWIDAAQGDYQDAPAQREVQLALAEISPVAAVTVDGKPLDAAGKSGYGWQRSNPNTLSLHLPALAVKQAHHIDIRYQAKEKK